MGLFSVFLLSFGAFCVSSATECVPATAKCNVYWEKTLPHKDLIASEGELDLWCSKQARFYKCLEDILLGGKNGSLPYLPVNLLVSKLFSQDLCTDESTSRSRLLSNAECINKLDTDFCILPEYLDIVTEDDTIPSTRCSQAEKTFSCIAATIVLNCGFDAGRVYRTMLKITRYSDEVCGIETSEGIPPCEERNSKSGDKELSEVYYGLFHKIGSVLDEDDVNETELADSVSEEEESMENVDEVIAEALQIAIDRLGDASEECSGPECYDSETDLKSPPCLKETNDYETYMRNPVITEVFKDMLFYDYSGQEYAVYWRQPEFSIVDNFECRHLDPSYIEKVIFRCDIKFRYNDPDCLSNTTVHEKLTPEFIRTFDPEVPCDSEVKLGPQPEWMKIMDEAYEKKNLDQMRSTLASVVTESPDILSASSYLLHIISTACSMQNMNSIFPNHVHNMMIDVFLPDPKKYAPPHTSIKVGDGMIFLLFDSELTKYVENLKCSRLDECSQRGKGLWKCKIWPRKIEVCEGCGLAVPKEEAPMASILESSGSKFTILETTEPTIMVEGSGKLAESTPDETIALIFSGDTETEENFASVGPEAGINDFLSMKDEVSSEDQYRLQETDIDKVEYSLVPENDGSEVQFQIMEVLNSNKDSEPSQVYTMDSDILMATDDAGLLAGNFYLVKDISDLNEAKYTIVSTQSTGEAV